MKSPEQAKSSSNSLLSNTKSADLPLIQSDTSGASTPFQLGQIFANRYCIKELIGAGTSGTVYIAFDQTDNKDIALKILLPELSSSECFLDEVRLAKTLVHASIVNVFDVQSDGRGDQAQWFITMELLKGQNLRSFLNSHEDNLTLVNIDKTLAIVAKLCDALKYAHDKTVHCNIKPENIFLTESGDIKLMDVGIAHLTNSFQSCHTGATMSTAYYKAPEQVNGRTDIDDRADQFALGILMYEMLSGAVPSRRIEPLNKVRKDVPAGLSKVIDKALSLKADDRFADINDFGLALANKGLGLRGLSMKKSIKSLGVVAAVLLVGGLTSLGGLADVWNSITPASTAEIAYPKGSVIKSLDEIKNYKQRLQNGQRQLVRDVRDAQQIDSPDLDALLHWQILTDNAIFEGSKILELEDELTVAETLLRESAFAEAQTAMDAVRDGYKNLWQQFTAADNLYEDTTNNKVAKQLWVKRQGDYGVASDEYVSGAEVAAGHNNIGKVKTQRYDAQQAALLNKFTGTMVVIPAGSFEMGSMHRDDEQPIHRVNINAFKMSEAKVNWAQYQPCIDAGACPNASDQGWGKGNRPVINVSYHDITQNYIPWLNQQTGKTFRLPTEAEWEYAARAGSSSKYSWGNSLNCSQARYGYASDECGRQKSTDPVKSFPSNAYGLYDMHGNVWEWTQDCWNGSYSGAPSNGSAWMSGDCSKRMLRGGSWSNYPDGLRSANRYFSSAVVRNSFNGFRLVQAL